MAGFAHPKKLPLMLLALLATLAGVARADQHHPGPRRADDEIYTDPVRLGYFLGIQQLVGEGHNHWSTTSKNGRYCYVSWSGTDQMSVIEYATRMEVARIDVGFHPQRVRTGTVRRAWLKRVRGD